MDKSTKILSEITVYMKYAKFLPNKNRRETWKELVTRNKKMHLKKYPELIFYSKELMKVFNELIGWDLQYNSVSDIIIILPDKKYILYNFRN